MVVGRISEVFIVGIGRYVYKHMIYISDGDWSGVINRELGGFGYQEGM